MKIHTGSLRHSLPFFALLLVLASSHALAQTQPDSASVAQTTAVPARITQAIDEAQLVRLKGNVHPLARAEFDQGLVDDATPMNRMLLVLKRSPEQQAALEKLMSEQLTKDSPNFHKWLTPQQFGQQFGPADADQETVKSWLSSHGFHDIKAAAGRTTIEFSGNVGQVRSAFGTEIHRFVVNGEVRQANASDPQIPAALTPVMAGIAALHNFPSKSMRHVVGTFTQTKDGRVIPQFTGSNGQFFALGPADFAKIYNIPTSLDGTGSKIAIVGISNINPNDVSNFRTLFGLPANPPNVVLNGPDPGINGTEGEADLDVQWSGAVAPNAQIDFVVSEGTLTSDPVVLSALYIIDNNTDDIMSVSFGNCEANLGTGGNGLLQGLWEQAAAQGITVTISAGDGGSAGCDNFNTATTATLGLAISGFASTPFNIAVGGTDFDDFTAPATQTNFWSLTNSKDGKRESALGYIHEITWNDSCAAAATGANLNTVCASANNIAGGSGGPSGLNAGAFAGYKKPPFQNGLTPPDNARDIPDISLFASNGTQSKSFYLVCQADQVPSGGAPSCAASGSFSFQGVGGTSASAPSFAGILALIEQSERTRVPGSTGRQGNANLVLYQVAATQSNPCDSSKTPLTGSTTCAFYDITKGNNAVPCAGGSSNCSSNTKGTNGVLVDPAHTSTPAWITAAGYDYATGLGSVNVANLAKAWGTAVGAFRPTTTSTQINGGTTLVTIMHGQPVTLSATVTASGTPTGDVSFLAPTTVHGGIDSQTLSGGTATINSVTSLPGGGPYNIKAHYAGDGTFAPSDDPTGVPVLVNRENSRLQTEIITLDLNGNPVNTNATSFAYGSAYILRFDILNSTTNACQPFVNGGTITGCALDATGTVIITDNVSPLDQGTFPVNSLGHGEDQPINLSGGSHSLSASYSGDISYVGAGPVMDIVTVSKATTTTAVASSPASIKSGTMVTLTATISTQSSGVAPSGTVQFLNGSTPLSGTVTLTPTDAQNSSTGFATLKATLTTTVSGMVLTQPTERTRPYLPYGRFMLLVIAILACAYILRVYPKRRRYVYASAVLFGVLTAGVAGCGGGGGGGGGAPQVKTVTIHANYSGDGNYTSSSGQTTITVQ